MFVGARILFGAGHFIRGMKCDMGINQWVHHPQNFLRKFTLQVCSPDEVEDRSWMSGHCSFAAVQYFIENFVRSGGYAVRKLPSACVTGYRHKAITHQSGRTSLWGCVPSS